MKGKLILQNGMEFEGKLFGHIHEAIGEVVFNTSMSGYQEVITDPASYGQFVVMTYPLIGNYGINLDDSESDSPKLKALIVREKANFPNNFRCELELDDYLKSNQVIGLEGVDTRALAKIIRTSGTMNAMIVLENTQESKDQIQQKIASHKITDGISKVSTKKAYDYSQGRIKVAVLDFGVKNSVLKNFAKRNCAVRVYPYNTTAEEILKDNPDLIFLSDGPSNPNEETAIVEQIKKLAAQKPIAAMCLGHQLLALAFGGKVGKLTSGHFGGHPVKNLLDGRVYATAQSHSYYVEEAPEGFEVTHISVNDKTIEGMKNNRCYSVQFHPEGAPGPAENEYVFDEFIQLAQEVQNA